MDAFDTFAFGSVVSAVLIVLTALICAALEDRRKKLKTGNVNGATVENQDPLEILSRTPVEDWYLWVYWFLRALSKLAPKKEYEHFLRDLERVISFRLSNGSWQPDQDF